MSTAEFKKLLEEDIKWRTQEIALVKKAVLRRDQTATMKIVQRRYAVPSMYAIWEGFIVTALSAYVDELSKRNISVSKVQRNLFAYELFKEFSLYETPKVYEKRVSLADRIRNHLTNVCKYKTPIETNSNVDFKELVFLLKRFAISEEGLDRYESSLMKMISLRNQIAHGKRDVSITESNINEFSLLIEDVMGDVSIRITDALRKKAYLK